MDQQPDYFIGDLDAQRQFAQKNNRLPELLGCLNDLTQAVLNCPQPESNADNLILELGSLATEDLAEIVTLCFNGLGRGAMKLLRGMFERTITLFHIDQYPDEAALFENYRYIDVYKMAVQLEESHPGEFFSKEKFAEVKAKRQEVIDSYKVKCECRKDCQERVVGSSWSKMGIVSMAKSRGFKGRMLVYGYYLPLLETHPKMAAIQERISIRYGESEKDDGSAVLGFAVYFMFEIVRAIKDRFKLDSIEELYQRCLSMRTEIYGASEKGPADKAPD